MFKHILVPTDGSSFSEAAVRKAVSLAKDVGARITALYAKPEFRMAYYADGIAMSGPVVDNFASLAEEEAQRILGFVETQCLESGVSCKRLSVSSDVPYEAIIKAASENGCDLIFMASHGRRGLSGLLLGSETNKVLSHTKIPVLVYR